MAVVGGLSSDEQLDAEEGPPFGGDILADDQSTDRQNKVCAKSDREIPCKRIDAIEKFCFPQKLLSRSDNFSSMFWTRSDKCVRIEFRCMFGENNMSLFTLTPRCTHPGAYASG
jgi:hypothetical protein